MRFCSERGGRGIIADLTYAIQTESDNILLAKQKATDTMAA